MLVLEIIILFALILFNGFMAMSELAVVSARRARLQARSNKGEHGARRALELSADPGRFLSTVQIGITLVGVTSGAISGATIGVRLSDWLMSLGVSASLANPAGVGVVVALITYVSLVIGELVPKQLALRHAETIAVRVAPFMLMMSRITLPFVWLLDASGNAVLALLRQNTETSRRVTDEEIRTLIAEAEHTGTIETAERRMIGGVMRLADRKARALMTPRGDVDWLDITAGADQISEALRNTNHTRVPVGEGSMDHLIGVVNTRELLASELSGEALDPRRYVHQVPIVHDLAGALDVLTMLREAELPMALVHDEYGSFEGIITPADILEAIAGVFRADLEEGETDAVHRPDGSWLLPGLMPADEMADHLRIDLPEERSYTTLAGFLLSYTQELPKTGAVVEVMGWSFEIVDLDGRRIDRVLATKIEGPGEGKAEG
ncbi:hemolysin family protein [Chelativorans sp. M5D2P16]|uniref:hemolysin family protein n=1 Tax=Chelativorans sp. M5D2P16 TaxID=3095678 RepID=UPI002ACA5404|nr:hemolysin family protein [Chelativorans sp. M5D2P16]MDZ5698036.1 hemolysin family protein [Chelativorans sp. M5D2P16]